MSVVVKMSRSIFALTLMSLVPVGLAWADDPPSAESVLLDSDASDELFDDSLLPRQRIGRRGNTAIISQRGPGENITNIVQSNRRNLAISLQHSSGGLNQSEINQSGQRNVAVSAQFGSENDASLTQSGYGNLILSEQVGTNNSLTHQQNGDHLGLIVRQYGESQIVVTQSTFGQ